MAFEINKVYKQNIPALRFIGHKHDLNVHGWNGDDWDVISKIEASLEKPLSTVYEDGNAYCNLYWHKEDEPVKWYVGIFMPENSKVPDGLFYHDFDKSTLGVCWIYGKENEVPGHWSECKKIIEEKGYKILCNTDGSYWCFERDGCPRFTTPDEKGNVIEDVCYFIE
jgi:hypothetical protein